MVPFWILIYVVSNFINCVATFILFLIKVFIYKVFVHTLLLHGWMLVHYKVTPQHYDHQYPLIHLGEERQAKFVVETNKVFCTDK